MMTNLLRYQVDRWHEYMVFVHLVLLCMSVVCVACESRILGRRLEKGRKLCRQKMR